MTIEAKVIADSVSNEDKRITTLQLKYPRFIHSEFMTHRVFSRNASSSRAIPVKKMIDQVRTNPATPIHWGANQKGMQAEHELSGREAQRVGHLWMDAMAEAVMTAERMMSMGVHKQVANRLLEPFQHIHVVVTATEWDNFFELRDHKDAQPEIRELARCMKESMEGSDPELLEKGDWHTPYFDSDSDQLRVLELVSGGEGKFDERLYWKLACRISAARCCRVSYVKHDGVKASVEEELALCDRLVGARPLHASPFEHQAMPDARLDNGNWARPALHGNLEGWVQFRKQLERSAQIQPS